MKWLHELTAFECLQMLFWDMASVEWLIQKYYPWFLQALNNYRAEVNKADAVRPFIMHKFGGVYLDIDTECFCSMDESLQNHSLIFQVGYLLGPCSL